MDIPIFSCYNLLNFEKGRRLMAKNNKNRGFTFVELIVVLVILAILAALLILALTGYIDKTKRARSLPKRGC